MKIYIHPEDRNGKFVSPLREGTIHGSRCCGSFLSELYFGISCPQVL
jgi:hypothetical protein